MNAKQRRAHASGAASRGNVSAKDSAHAIRIAPIKGEICNC